MCHLYTNLRKCKSVKAFQKSWGLEEEKAFKAAKESVKKATLLVHPKVGAPTELWTDASDNAAGAVLVQKQRSHWCPVAYWSRAFNNAQKQYSAFDKELIALSYAIDHFRDWLEGQQVTVRTDHMPIVSALSKTTNKFTPLQRRHLNRIAQYADKVFQTVLVRIMGLPMHFLVLCSKVKRFCQRRTQTVQSRKCKWLILQLSLVSRQYQR